jgi:hypothetical protein
VNKAQWITISIGILIVAALFLFGRTGPHKSGIAKTLKELLSLPSVAVAVLSVLFSEVSEVSVAKQFNPSPQAKRP